MVPEPVPNATVVSVTEPPDVVVDGVDDVKVAVTEWSPFIVMEQIVDVAFAQSPAQPPKVEAPDGEAVKVTTVPAA